MTKVLSVFVRFSCALHLGRIDDTKTLDEVFISIFKGPNRILVKIQSKFVMARLTSNNKLFNYCSVMVAEWQMQENSRLEHF
jgi:hypothetical protein